MSDLIVDIADDALLYVACQAIRTGFSEVEIVRRALEAYRFLDEVQEQDGEVVLRRADGHLERLVNI